MWVAIKPDDTCVIRIARSEMGQGTLTGLAQLVAEELECDWSKVTTEQITPGTNLARKRAWGEMGTGGSRGIRTSQDYVRRGGAAARIMLLQAAADEWKVPVGRAHGRQRRHHSSRIPTFGELRQGRRGGRQDRAAGSQEHQAQGSEGLDDRGQAAEAARYRGQAQWQQGLRHRRPAAGHAVRRHQGLPGLRRQAEELRRGEDRRHAGRAQGGEGEGHRRRGRRRHLVAGEDGRSMPCRSSGTRAPAPRNRARPSPSTSRRGSPRPPPTARGRTATRPRRSRARPRRSRRSTARRSSPMPAWSR